MKHLKTILISAVVLSSALTYSCSCDSEETSSISIYPDVEAVAKEHARQFANGSLSEMQIQQKLFEVRAHEQDLRDENLNAEADYYIKMFTKHLKKTNPDLAKQIK